jgi:hypothetical protein
MASEWKARELSERAAREFGPRIGTALDALGLSNLAVAEQAGCDAKTVDRMCDGTNGVLLSTACKVLMVVRRYNAGMADALIRELFAVSAGDDEQRSADFNRDGRIDRDDLFPGVARLHHRLDELMAFGVEALANDGQVDDAEHMRALQLLKPLAMDLMAFEALLRVLNIHWRATRFV